MNLTARDSLIGMVASPLVWASHFVISYGLVAVACAFGFGTAADGGWDAIRIILVVVSAVALGLIAALTFLAYRRQGQSGGSDRPRDPEQARHRFMAVAALLLGILSGIGVAYAMVPVFMLSTCQ